MLTVKSATAQTQSLQLTMRRGFRVLTWKQDIESKARWLHEADATNELIAVVPVKIALDLTNGGDDAGIISGPAISTKQKEA